MRIIPGTETFYLRGNRKLAVLLVHGYTGSTAEMLLLGERLNADDFTVVGVRLPGHGTSVEDLAARRAPEWYAAAAQQVEALMAQGYKVAAVGQSMGSLLVLKAAAEYPLARAAVLCAPLWVKDRRARLTCVLKYFLPILRRTHAHYNLPDRYQHQYDRMPTAPLPSMFKLARECRELYVAKIKQPLLIVQAKTERTVQPRSAQFIFDNCSTTESDKELLWLEHSGHVITLGDDHTLVEEKIIRFMRKDAAANEMFCK